MNKLFYVNAVLQLVLTLKLHTDGVVEYRTTLLEVTGSNPSQTITQSESN